MALKCVLKAGVGAESEASKVEVGARVSKKFRGYGWYHGRVVSVGEGKATVHFVDEKTGDCYVYCWLLKQVEKILVDPDSVGFSPNETSSSAPSSDATDAEETTKPPAEVEEPPAEVEDPKPEEAAATKKRARPAEDGDDRFPRPFSEATVPETPVETTLSKALAVWPVRSDVVDVAGLTAAESVEGQWNVFASHIDTLKGGQDPMIITQVFHTLGEIAIATGGLGSLYTEGLVGKFRVCRSGDGQFRRGPAERGWPLVLAGEPLNNMYDRRIGGPAEDDARVMFGYLGAGLLPGPVDSLGLLQGDMVLFQDFDKEGHILYFARRHTHETQFPVRNYKHLHYVDNYGQKYYEDTLPTRDQCLRVAAPPASGGCGPILR